MGAKRADDFMRLFVVPGMHHCGGGTGPSEFGQGSVPAPADDPSTNLAAALEAWVEKGRAPEQVIARQVTPPGSAENNSLRTGLICAFPKRAKLASGADAQRAESYSCRDP